MDAPAPTKSARDRLPEACRALYPFASHWHPVGEHALHYLDEGSGRPVVMVHGNPTWSFYYRNMVAGLRDTHRVIAPDHMGCGFSDKPQVYPYTLATHINNLEALLTGLDLHDITLMVHDWGGAIGMGFAVRHPGRIKRLVILNTAAFYVDRVPLRIRLCRIPLFGAFAVRGLNGFVRASLRMAINHHDRMTPDVRQGYLAPYDNWANRVAHHRFVQDIPRVEGDPSYAVIQDIAGKLPLFANHPVLIQWGRLDWCFTMDFLARWQAVFPQAQVDVHDDAAHYVLEDAHERILPRVREFLS